MGIGSKISKRCKWGLLINVGGGVFAELALQLGWLPFVLTKFAFCVTVVLPSRDVGLPHRSLRVGHMVD